MNTIYNTYIHIYTYQYNIYIYTYLYIIHITYIYYIYIHINVPFLHATVLSHGSSGSTTPQSTRTLHFRVSSDNHVYLDNSGFLSVSDYFG